jgi:hypothetical protein
MFVALAVALATVSLLRAQDTEVASLTDAGTFPNSYSGIFGLDIAVDGNGHRLVVFSSAANDLVAGDTNGLEDIFLRDMTAGTTECISRGSGGAESDGASYYPRISKDDGRYVVFESYATNLDPIDTDSDLDVFLLDRTTGAVECISVNFAGTSSGDGRSGDAFVSEGGRYVAFSSTSTDLINVDANGFTDVFVRDRKAATTACASVNLSGVTGNETSFLTRFGEHSSMMSADGLLVMFTSYASDLVRSDNNGTHDAFLRDMGAGTTTRVSLDSNGKETPGGSDAARIPRKKSVALFGSADPGVLPGFSNGVAQTYAFVLGTRELLPAVAQRDGDPVADSTIPLHISGDDGSDFDPIVFFWSDDEEIVSDDDNATADVFGRTLRGGAVQRIDVASDGAQSSGDVYYRAAASIDGRYVAFASKAGDLVTGDSNNAYDAFVRGLCWTKFAEFGVGLAGSGGFVPRLFGRSGSCEELGYSLHVADGLGGAFGYLWIGLGKTDLPLFGGHFYIDFAQFNLPVPIVLGGTSGVAGAGTLDVDGANVESLVDLEIYLQCLFADPAAVSRVSLTNAIELSIE